VPRLVQKSQSYEQKKKSTLLEEDNKVIKIDVDMEVVLSAVEVLGR
jgi:hypothetical protein